MTVELKVYLAERQTRINQQLDQWLPPAHKPPQRLNAAIRHSLMSGGKRLRPILALAACDAVGGDTARSLPFACALECIHTYSLIHDDLPAMDDDDLRRGQPTCHRQFDEATAILAGDALLTFAFQLIAEQSPPEDAALTLELIAQLARDAGVLGMVGGQMFDMEAEHRSIDFVELQNIHIHKTGALIRFACTAGAHLGGGTPEQCQALNRYGEAIGLAFQITDDILDEVGDPERLGKATGSDRRQAKATYTALLGIAQARTDAQALVQIALERLTSFGPAAEPLRLLARHIIQRTH
jgi:geranylgeranyl diphosphate synthase type II